ncbi:MAG: hypothetical protein IKR97_02975, partial [Eubacterium sp.]|nr:hypothetical protein [Eubacterium sp.]
ESGVFIAEYSSSANNQSVSCNKTFAQITQAINSGKAVFAKLENKTYSLSYNDASRAIFVCTYIFTEGSELWINYLQIEHASDNTVTSINNSIPI